MTVLDEAGPQGAAAELAVSSTASGSRFSIVWEPSAGSLRPEAARETGSVDHAAHYAMALAHTLAQAGHPAQRLEISVVASAVNGSDGPITALQLEVTGQVPGLDGPSFESLARIAVSGCRIWNALPGSVNVHLLTHLLGPPSGAPVPRLPPPTRVPDVAPPQAPRKALLATVRRRPWGLVLLLGIGALLLPRVLVSSPEPRATGGLEASPAEPTSAPSPAAMSSVVPTLVRPFLDQRFTTAQGEWPDDPRATAWFGDGTYHLFARQPARFVAVSAPTTPMLTDVEVHGVFRKLGGPPGGGYGLIVRDATAEGRDGRDQSGRFVVAEVGDRGEIGIWRREQDHWVDLLAWTPSAAVRAGQAANELTLSVSGGQLTLAVNGNQVAQVLDGQMPPSGRVGVFVGGDLNQVALDWFAVELN